MKKNKKILKENGIILIHRDKKDLDQFPNNFKILEDGTKVRISKKTQKQVTSCSINLNKL